MLCVLGRCAPPLECLTATTLSKVLVYFITKMLAENQCSTNSSQGLRVLIALFEISFTCTSDKLVMLV